MYDPTHNARSLKQLLEQAGISHECTQPLDTLCPVMITTHSQDVIPGSIFVAVKGAQNDGHQFIPQALTQGACAIIREKSDTSPTDEPSYTLPGVNRPVNAATIYVDDSKSALAKLSTTFYGLAPAMKSGALQLIGVTGTNGKSTTCDLIHQILTRSGHLTALLGTIRYDLVGKTMPASLTTPPPIELSQYLAESHSRGARFAVMEVSSHALAQKRTSGLRYQVAVFTNLSGDHLDYHQNLSEYLRTKKTLFDLLDADAVAIVNADDPYHEEIIKDTQASVVTYGVSSEACVQAHNIKYSIDGCEFEMNIRDSPTRTERHFKLPEGTIAVHLPLPGKHNVLNALAATSAAAAMGIDWSMITQHLSNATPVRGRLQRASPDSCLYSVFVDYAHTDDALRNVLETLRPLTHKRLWCIFGCGGDRDRSKRPRMAAVASKLADRIVITNDNPRTESPSQIVEDILFGLPDRNATCVLVMHDRRAAILHTLENAAEGDSVLIAGKGHEDYQILGHQRIHFDDAEVVQAYFATREDTVSPE